MAWLVALAILIAPFVLVRSIPNLALRVGLVLLFCLACGAGGVWFLTQSRGIRKDLETVHTYPLPAETGVHRVTIAPLSQKSMKGVLTGGAAGVPPDQLKTLQWRFTDTFVRATWHTPKDDDGPGFGETLLFYVDGGGPDGPLTLEYVVDEGNVGLVRGRSLLVGHDASAKHLLIDHGAVFFEFFGCVLMVWAGLWMIVLTAMFFLGRRAKASTEGQVAG